MLLQASVYVHLPTSLQYYEVIVRYEKFFSVETSYIGPVLVSTSHIPINQLLHPFLHH